MIAMPCYQGQCHVRCMQSILNLTHIFKDNDIHHVFFPLDFESLIPRGRNLCASAFLKSDCSHLFFIDSDIQFNPSDVLKLLQHEKQIIVGLYPQKKLHFDKITQAIQSSITMKEFTQKCTQKNGNILQNTDSLDLVLMKDAPTGFMLIHRSVFDILIEKIPTLAYKNDVVGYDQFAHNGKIFNFFQVGVVNDRYLSEDYGFSTLCRACNIPIYADTSVELCHIGQFLYY